MINRLLIFVACTLAMVSCTQTHLETPFQGEKSETTVCRSLDEGLEMADLMFKSMYGTTRSPSRKVKSVEIFNQSTRTSPQESSFYIVNYDNNEGFVLLSADKRLEPVFAISDEGQMNLSDTIYNKSLAWYIRSIESLASNLSDDSNRFIVDTVPASRPETMTRIISIPLLNGILSKFHQRSPFNIHCFTTSGEQALVGCAPLAAGTLMGYYEWPKSYKGYSFDWKAMKSNSNHDGWARLFSFIGSPENMNVSYGVSSTGANYGTYCMTFGNFGYRNMLLADFTIDGVNKELENGKPVMVRGTDYNKRSGHAWIIDGAHSIEHSHDSGSEVPQTYYYHCVWGWGGIDNGYFAFYNYIGVEGYTFTDLQYIANLQQ